MALRETLPVSPPAQVMVRLLLTWVFGCTVSDAGEAVIKTLGSAVTFKVKVAFTLVPAPVPVTVTVAVPVVAVSVAVNVRVLLPEPVTVSGLKVAVTPAGSVLLTARVTGLEKPPAVLTVTLLVPVWPCITVAPLAVRANPEPEMLGSTGKAF